MAQRKEPVKFWKIAFSTTNSEDLINYDTLKQRGISHAEIYAAGLAKLLEEKSQKNAE